MLREILKFVNKYTPYEFDEYLCQINAWLIGCNFIKFYLI